MKRTGFLFGLTVIVAISSGCFLGTPLQELTWAGAKIERLEPSPIRLRLSGRKFDDFELSLAGFLCANHSSQFSELRELDLSDSRVTDDGLRSMARNPHLFEGLRLLNLKGCRVSKDVVEELQRSLGPSCEIVR